MRAAAAGFIGLERGTSEATTRRQGTPALLTVGGAAVLLALAFANGGYFATSWGWATLALLSIAAVALVVQTALRVSALEACLLGLLAAFAGWVASSAFWAHSATSVLLDEQRVLVYLAFAAAAVLTVRRSTYASLAYAVWSTTSIVSLASLATRLFPERFGVFDPIARYRLSEPIGYWNALGIFMGIGTLVALGLAARAANPVVRALAAASTVPMLATLYFTFGRGPWIALAAGLIVMLAIDSRRPQMVVATAALVPWPALGLWLGSRSEALTRQDASLAGAGHQGHALAIMLAGLAICAAGVTVVLAAAEERVHPSRRLQRASALLLCLVVAAAATAVFARYGNPVTLARKGYDGFTAPPRLDPNLNRRLFSFSGNGRSEQWRVAWQEYTSNPLLGSGAGSYSQYWFRDRRGQWNVQDAHNLYLETLAELGPVGLALLVSALLLPLAAAIAARSRPFVPALAGAYTAFLVHAAVDWDWEMPAITLAALACGAAVLAAARRTAGRTPTRAFRLSAAALALGVGAVAAIGLVGNTAVAASSSKAQRGLWPDAEREARKAIDWAPWSAEPWQRLGEAQLGRGDRSAAGSSFRRALQKDRHDWRLWFELGLASSGQGRANALAEAHRLNPLSDELAQFGRANPEPRKAAR